MRNSSSFLSISANGGNDTFRPQSKQSFSQGKQLHSINSELKTTTITSLKQNQQQSNHARRPFQVLDGNTAVVGTITSLKQLIVDTKKMAKSEQHLSTENVMISRKTYSDDEASTITANENNEVKVNETPTLEALETDSSGIFRRRMDASDEAMEDYWLIRPANPIMDSDDDDEEDNEQYDQL